jgi:hypothetical protein
LNHQQDSPEPLERTLQRAALFTVAGRLAVTYRTSSASFPGPAGGAPERTGERALPSVPMRQSANCEPEARNEAKRRFRVVTVDCRAKVYEYEIDNSYGVILTI